MVTFYSLFPTTTEVIIFQIVLILWILSEIVGGTLIPYIRRGGVVLNRKDKGSGLFIFFIIFLSIITASIFASAKIAILPNWFFYPGIIVMILGIIFRQWSITVLGRFFSGTVSTQEGQKVVEKGPYKYIRHPSYTGALLILIGMGLALQSWGAVITLILLFSLAYGYRIHIEENILISELGNPYIEYKKRTKRLIPYII
jgi:protein-S-isoprenylcysteine O-methyltransferase Ste14